MGWMLLCEGLDASLDVQTFAQIEHAIARAIAVGQKRYGRPTSVELSSDESAMSIVVGGKRSCAMFMYTPNGPGFSTRRRDAPQHEEENPFVFMMSGSWTEVDPNTTVLPEEAWEALRLYFETGKRPETLDWDS